jgi:hypothetical protein
MILILLGVPAAALGLFINFAGSMSTVPNDSLGRKGCAGLIIGLFLIGAGLWEVLL